MGSDVKTPKKLIEVALPLDAINKAAAREKSIRHGHPSTLHLWWARRPLAAARAVIFAQMVNDPGYERQLGRGINKVQAQAERERLFRIIEQLVQWENSNNETLLKEAQDEIVKSWRETCKLNSGHPQAHRLFDPDHVPVFHDPFSGGGAIPFEAQRLGLETYASDLNPVAQEMNFPRFLLIDTPDTAGIDDDNLKRAISKIPEVIGKDRSHLCQVILTTGVGMYPKELKGAVSFELTKKIRLLKEKPKKEALQS